MIDKYGHENVTKSCWSHLHYQKIHIQSRPITSHVRTNSTPSGHHSCIQLPKANGNNFELKPQFINTLPKFHGMESKDANFFIRQFEEVCLMMSIPQLGEVPQLSEDAVRLWFIPFALKDLAKKWLYSLAVGSISSWDDFVKVSRPASQNTLERRRDTSRWRIYARKIPHVYVLSLK